jgi:starvation-inducible DNA-binding protein
MTATQTPTASTFVPAGIDRSEAAEINSILQDRLVSLIDLSLTLKHIHWNVVGPGFIAVHEMLDEHVVGIRDASDALAERITTLGGIPNGLPGFLTTQRSWTDYSLGRGVVEAHLGALDKVYDGIIADHREAAARIAQLDPVTEDLLIAQTGMLELNQWFVRAHVANTSGELMSGTASTQMDAAVSAATGDPLQ